VADVGSCHDALTAETVYAGALVERVLQGVELDNEVACGRSGDGVAVALENGDAHVLHAGNREERGLHDRLEGLFACAGLVDCLGSVSQCSRELLVVHEVTSDRLCFMEGAQRRSLDNAADLPERATGRTLSDCLTLHPCL